MTVPNASGGTDSLAVTGVGPGTIIFAIVGIALTIVGGLARRLSNRFQ